MLGGAQPKLSHDCINRVGSNTGEETLPAFRFFHDLRSQEIPDALKQMDQVVLLPHVGSATVETRQAMGDLVVENLLTYLREGRAVTPVPECRDL